MKEEAFYRINNGESNVSAEQVGDSMKIFVCHIFDAAIIRVLGYDRLSSNTKLRSTVADFLWLSYYLSVNSI